MDPKTKLYFERSVLKHRPQYTEGQKSTLKALFRAAEKDIVSTQIYTRRQYKEDEDARRAAGDSAAAYTGEMQYWIDLPPYDE